MLVAVVVVGVVGSGRRQLTEPHCRHRGRFVEGGRTGACRRIDRMGSLYFFLIRFRKGLVYVLC